MLTKDLILKFNPQKISAQQLLQIRKYSTHEFDNILNPNGIMRLDGPYYPAFLEQNNEISGLHYWFNASIFYNSQTELELFVQRLKASQLFTDIISR